jgi:hypothetical protein
MQNLLHYESLWLVIRVAMACGMKIVLKNHSFALNVIKP